MLSLACLVLGVLAHTWQAEPLTVSAAVSLTDAFEEIARAYRATGGGPVSFNFAGSNVLARQIVSGAPVDVFVSADAAQMDVVERAGRLVPGSRVPVASNQLVVVVGERSSAVRSVKDLVAADVRRIAIGDPAAVPAGVYAKAYLEHAGLWSQLEGKIVPTPNVRAALTAVQNASADAAIVYVTDARTAPSLRVAAVIDGPGSPRIVYPAAIVANARHLASARRFVEFLRSPAAHAVLVRHGFRPISSPR